MSVQPVFLKDIRRTAITNHQLSTGTGNYNIWSPLAQRERVASMGKRRLSDKGENNPHQGNASKAPRFDSTSVFNQLKGQETLLTEVKGNLGKINYDVVIGQVLPQPVKKVIVGMGPWPLTSCSNPRKTSLPLSLMW
jgi:hypothetical protein